MKTIQIQMLDRNVSSDWWKKIIQHFVKQGDEFEIRCWNEEHEEIKKAQAYGRLFQDGSGTETSIKGVVSEHMIKELLTMPKPTDKTIYNKMTDFFTFNIENKICSAHYGTEMYLFNVSEDDVEIFKKIMSPCWESFSILIEEQKKE